MNKVLTFALVLLWTLSLTSAPITYDQAQTVAVNFLNTTGMAAGKSQLIYVSFGQKLQEPLIYIFNYNDAGFIIVAGDDAVTPILGYSQESVFTGEKVPGSLTAMIDGFSSQIAYIRNNSIQADQNTAAKWSSLLSDNIPVNKGYSVNQLLTCQWDQGSPYNALCPSDPAGPGNHVYAGCVATAIAMTMYYHRYPVQPTGYHSYYSDYGQLSVDFTQSHYNFEQMPFQISSENYDVAKIQYDCGVAVDMMYSPNGSGAYMEDALNAMKEHFGYNPTATLEYKSDYSESSWINLLKNQINAGYPMPYAGYDVSSGHAFVCDGYNNDDMFHFNWGWSGAYNGYFYISNLNPGYNFSTGQQAMINCYPAAVTYPLACGNFQMNSRSGSMEVGHGISGYTNNQNCTWLIAPPDSVEHINIEFRYLKTEQGNDVVTIYQGSDASAPVVGTYSGISGDFTVQVPGNRVYITFQSNSSITDGGFHADYYAYTPQFCSIFNINTESSGSINDGSHNYPYNNNTFCRWRIEPQNAGGIIIDFTDFKTEQSSDILAFYTYPEGVYVCEFSGSTLPQSFFINSPKAMVVFRTNDDNAEDGFTFNYHAVATSLDEFQNASMYVSVNENNYPVLNISHFPADEYSVELSDITGRALYASHKVVTDDNERIEIPYIPENAGLYLITLKGDNISRTLKYFAR